LPASAFQSRPISSSPRRGGRVTRCGPARRDLGTGAASRIATSTLYGVSSGGALALEAAAAGLAIEKLAVYEVPYFIGGEASLRWRDYLTQLGAALADGRLGDALELFHRLTGFSEEDIAAARKSPFWPRAEALEHTLAYDAACVGDGHPPIARLAGISQPTLVATGDAAEFIAQAADAIAASIPNSKRQTLEGQGHVVDPKAIAPVLERFFGE
jgi:pimeloyl-ACP methyl ester carboxylesterase